VSSNIYIFSRPIRSGKTTELLLWIKDHGHVTGIVAPDIDGKRKLLDLATGWGYHLELDEPTDNSITVGRFHFDNEVFGKIREALLKEMTSGEDWLVVDEVGKLEIEQNAGLEPAVGAIIQHYKTSDKKLLLVIRDTLLEKAITHYELQDAIVVHNLNDL
jgi:nucleoside-triphosphatase